MAKVILLNLGYYFALGRWGCHLEAVVVEIEAETDVY